MLNFIKQGKGVGSIWVIVYIIYKGALFTLEKYRVRSNYRAQKWNIKGQI